MENIYTQKTDNRKMLKLLRHPKYTKQAIFRVKLLPYIHCLNGWEHFFFLLPFIFIHREDWTHEACCKIDEKSWSADQNFRHSYFTCVFVMLLGGRHLLRNSGFCFSENRRIFNSSKQLHNKYNNLVETRKAKTRKVWKLHSRFYCTCSLTVQKNVHF